MIQVEGTKNVEQTKNHFGRSVGTSTCNSFSWEVCIGLVDWVEGWIMESPLRLGLGTICIAPLCEGLILPDCVSGV